MTPLRHRLQDIVGPAVDLLYPPRCPICGDAIGNQGGLCMPCWEELEVPKIPACMTCNRPLRSLDNDTPEQCTPCLNRPPIHDGIVAGTVYNDASRKLILSFKHGRRIALSPLLARLIAARLPDLEGEWLFIPVPLHPLRLWKRGFNQAALLARDMARLRNQRLLFDGLRRSKATRSLGGLGRRERERTLANAIAMNPRRAKNVRGAKIVLVDDVLTSGATSDSCVRVLKRAGARTVVVACFARVLTGGE